MRLRNHRSEGADAWRGQVGFPILGPSDDRLFETPTRTEARIATRGKVRPEDLDHMRRALALAEEAGRLGEVPVGAVLVLGESIVAQGFNLRETLHDPTAHAERVVLTLAGQAARSWRLDGSTLYVTLEPCPMCAGAIVQSRVSRVVYGAVDRKAGACDSLYRITDDPRLNHRADHVGGVLAEESAALLTRFFQNRRSRGR